MAGAPRPFGPDDKARVPKHVSLNVGRFGYIAL